MKSHIYSIFTSLLVVSPIFAMHQQSADCGINLLWAESRIGLYRQQADRNAVDEQRERNAYY